MAKELYVGSLSYDVTEYDLEKLFSVSGRVTSIHLITDNKTGEFKGCGYVRMSTEAEAKDAILSLDGALLLDRKITVSMANPQKQQTGGYKGKSPFPKKSGAAAKGPAGGKGLSAKPAASAKPASAKPASAKSASAKSASAKPAASPKPAKPAAKAGSKPASKPAPKKGAGR